MARLLHILITLPLIASPLSLLASNTLHAETLSQMDALRLLAKSKAADAKCQVLPSGDADELGSYLARAEVAATQRGSVQDTQGTIAVGKALGEAAACNDRTAEEVTDTLDASRRAMAAVEDPRTMRRQSAASSSRTLARSEDSLSERLPVTIKGYRQQAFAYYLERRCRHLTSRQARSFWSSIIRQHRAALRSDGRKAVATVLRNAEAAADDMSCGVQSRRIVRAEYSQSSAF